jgi:hypothetical protein
MSNAFEGVSRMDLHWIAAWFRERIVAGWWWLGPASISIALIGGTRLWFLRTLAAAFALISLRLLDDVGDVAHDRKNHPERALCQLDSLVQPYVFSVVALVFSGLFVVMLGANSVIYLATLFLIVFATRMRQTSGANLRVIYAHVMLLKFPALAIALSTAAIKGPSNLDLACFLYGFVGGFEVLHDPEARQSNWAAFLFGLDLVCLAGGLAYYFFRSGK